ncbi:MAG TPA: tetratricopeptide repeat protein, partial [Tepidisphaeraceae bacterium]|nr:tetratricopeptide repeat protein [Tepidisphaeraceae bacterium]
AAGDAPNAASASQVHNNWATALLAMDQPGEAFDHLRTAERLNPDAFDPHYNLGQLLYRAGQYDAAVVELGKAVRIKPDHVGAQRALTAAQAAAAAASGTDTASPR